MIQPLTQGTKAPDFSLLDQHNAMHSLSQYRGKKVLIYFYPKALTPGCTTQACGLRDHLEAFHGKSVIVLGISPDLPSKLQRFDEKHQLGFTLLSDPDHLVADRFGIWGEKKFLGKTFNGIHRKSFLIDEEGNILHYFDQFKTANHHQVVLDFLEN